jgi:hypothetical protein
MKRFIAVNNCGDCPSLSVHDDMNEFVCYKSCRIIENKNNGIPNIPDWCPLPEYKEIK